MTRRQDNGFIAQLYLLSAYDDLWENVLPHLSRHRVVYECVDVSKLSPNSYALLCMAYDIEYGTSHTDLNDLSSDEVVDFDIFCALCCAIVINAYGHDAVRVAARRKRGEKNG